MTYLIYRTVLQAVMQLMFYHQQFLSAGFKLFRNHTSKCCLMSEIQDYPLAQGPRSVWHYTVTSGTANFTQGSLISY